MLNDPNWLTQIAEMHKSPGKSYFGLDAAAIIDGVTAVGGLVISWLLNFAANLECVYDPFLFPVLGTKESIKKGKTIFAIQLAVYIYQKYIQCIFIYLFILYSEISDRFPENGGNRCGSAPGKECFSLKKTYICTTGFTLVVMGFCSP